jgi:GNAT superfamily N-acetyltransferase
VDVFGTLQLNLHQNPESIDPVLQDDLVDVAQSAFTADGFPTEKDVKQHILPADSLITAEIDGEAVGFAATDGFSGEEVFGEEAPYEASDVVYAAGISVHPDYQGTGVGKLMRTRGALEMLEGDAMAVTRTQNPAVLSYMNDLFDAYPEPGAETPEHIQYGLEEFAGLLDPDADYEDHVMHAAYGGPTNETLPEGYDDFNEYVRENLDLENGDALMVGGEASEKDLENSYHEMVENRDYEVHEEVV